MREMLSGQPGWTSALGAYLVFIIGLFFTVIVSSGSVARSGTIVSVKEGWPPAKRWRLPEDVRKRDRRERERQGRHDKARADAEAEAKAFRLLMERLAGPPKSRGVAAKIANLLGMLGSDHDGEVLNAARHAERLRKESDLTWPQLLKVDPST